MNRPRLIKGLKIAWTAFWSVVAVSLIVLWVRSYWFRDAVSGTNGSRYLSVDTFCGEVHCRKLLPISASMSQPRPWSYYHVRSDDFEQQVQHKSEKLILCNWLGTGRMMYANGWEAVVPLWPAPLVAGYLLVISWLRFRFTLRTLLVAITLVAIVLGVIV